eukprot:CAMPEP_0177593178 /NCGR_PEP_ID=MMETSP0419_2-20121207/8993_1 /TAXON_ID=582737 /ORGANISM="Tetraselmis sp., Strain GSL018" /LENGTH=401 /DNA_ID=CAMNT_0019084171 /DNA_START=84 /DNA_END=1286 /DNA_ORIENTATION=-
MNIRCRGPNGSATLSGVEPTLTIADFQELIEQKTLIPVGLQEILSGGFPPEILKLPENPTAATVSELPIKGGDSITVRSKKDSTHSVAPTGAEDVPERNGFQQPLRDTASPANANMSEDEALAKAIRMSMVDGGARDSNSRANQDQTSTAREGSSGKGKAPTSVVLPSGSAVVRRVIDANDSCLFNAVGYVIERSLDKSAQLRRVIADAVAGDPELYNVVGLAWLQRAPSRKEGTQDEAASGGGGSRRAGEAALNGGGSGGSSGRAHVWSRGSAATPPPQTSIASQCPNSFGLKDVRGEGIYVGLGFVSGADWDPFSDCGLWIECGRVFGSRNDTARWVQSSFLGKEVEEYCRWIQEPHSWGGAIELSILSGCGALCHELSAPAPALVPCPRLLARSLGAR